MDAAVAMSPESFVHVRACWCICRAHPPHRRPITRAIEGVKSCIEAAAARRGDAIEIEVRQVPWLRIAMSRTRVDRDSDPRSAGAPRALLGPWQTNAGVRRAELVVVDNGSTDRRVAELLRTSRAAGVDSS